MHVYTCSACHTPGHTTDCAFGRLYYMDTLARQAREREAGTFAKEARKCLSDMERAVVELERAIRQGASKDHANAFRRLEHGATRIQALALVQTGNA